MRRSTAGQSPLPSRRSSNLVAVLGDVHRRRHAGARGDVEDLAEELAPDGVGGVGRRHVGQAVSARSAGRCRRSRPGNARARGRRRRARRLRARRASRPARERRSRAGRRRRLRAPRSGCCPRHRRRRCPRRPSRRPRRSRPRRRAPDRARAPAPISFVAQAMSPPPPGHRARERGQLEVAVRVDQRRQQAPLGALLDGVGVAGAGDWRAGRPRGSRRCRRRRRRRRRSAAAVMGRTQGALIRRMHRSPGCPLSLSPRGGERVGGGEPDPSTSPPRASSAGARSACCVAAERSRRRGCSARCRRRRA